MASKDFVLEDGLPVTVYKRRGNRHLRLTVAPSGKVRVSIPAWTPYRAGLEFAKTRQNWIRERMMSTRPAPLQPGQAVGKAHHLRFVPRADATRPGGRLSETLITINHSPADDFGNHAVQQAAHRACIRALRRQAENLLPQRLANLATTYGFTYTDVKVKHLKSRWGSCDQQGRIVLNLYLMQLPWELIDYVLLHELTHTRVLKHGPEFWHAMAEILPAAPNRKKNLRNYQPALLAADTAGYDSAYGIM